MSLVGWEWRRCSGRVEGGAGAVSEVCRRLRMSFRSVPRTKGPRAWPGEIIGGGVGGGAKVGQEVGSDG